MNIATSLLDDEYMDALNRIAQPGLQQLSDEIAGKKSSDAFWKAVRTISENKPDDIEVELTIRPVMKATQED